MWELERIRREGERKEGAGGKRGEGARGEREEGAGGEREEGAGGDLEEGAGGERALLDPAAGEVQMGLDGGDGTDGVDVGVGGDGASSVHVMRQAQILKVLCIY